ncbi:MAG: phosphoribosyltransferase [Armatimonadota bacterium]
MEFRRGLQTFLDRTEAGRLLSEPLQRFAGPDTIVLGVPRGGVVVAAEVARALDAPLDVIIARKIGAPMQPELAIGAVVSGGTRLLDERTIRMLRVSAEYIEEESRRQLEEIRRRVDYYRSGRPEPNLTGRTVIVVDDGIATGYTIRAALEGLRGQGVGKLVVAVPVAPPSAIPQLREIADEVVALRTPEPFMAVGAWYQDFDQSTDEEVARLLAQLGPAARLSAAA